MISIRGSWSAVGFSAVLFSTLITSSPAVADEAMNPAAAAAPDAASNERHLEPYIAIAGGVRFEDLDLREGQTTQERGLTVAVSRLGVRGRLGPYVTFVSAFEANLGGPLGYGASVWEGQAQMSVLDQYVRYERCGWHGTIGRITEDASLDFYSAHVADLLYADVYTRQPLLYSGVDRGTGLAVGFAPSSRLQFGLSAHATNPTGLTGTFLIGGELFPFDRPFSLAAAQVGRSEYTLPDQNLHIYFFTPSVTYKDDLLHIKVAMQGYRLDTNMANVTDEQIYGYNLRASFKLRLMDGRYAVFANASRNENEMLDPMNAGIKLVETYRSYTFGGGVDYQYWGDNGVGIQYVQVRQNEGMDPAVVDHYLNIGTTYWIQEGLSVGARVGWFIRDDEALDETYGHRSLFLTGRLLL